MGRTYWVIERHPSGGYTVFSRHRHYLAAAIALLWERGPFSNNAWRQTHIESTPDPTPAERARGRARMKLAALHSRFDGEW